MALEIQTRTPEPAAKAPAQSIKFELPSLQRRTVGDQDRMFFTEQLALLLETGANLYNALQTLQQQCANPAMSEVIAGMMTDISEGRPFSVALASTPMPISP